MPQNSFRLYQNPDGPVLGTVSAPILEQDGLFFKDLARTGQLLPYEDWRLDAQTRAEDLAARLSIEEIAGCIGFSSTSYFSQSFQKKFHESPQQFRKSHRVRT